MTMRVYFASQQAGISSDIVSSSGITLHKYGFNLCLFTFKILSSLGSSTTTALSLNTSLTIKGPSHLGFSLLEPKYAYLRPPSSGLSSSCGASSLECTSFFTFFVSSSKQDFHHSLTIITCCSSKLVRNLPKKNFPIHEYHILNHKNQQNY